MHSLLFLASGDAFRTCTSCRSLRALVADGETALSLWRQQAASMGGLHSSNGIWLHALLDASGISKYMKEIQGIILLNELPFRTAGDVSGLLAAVQSLSTVPGALFAGVWSFEVDSSVAKRLAGGGALPTPIRSHSACLYAMFESKKQLRFKAFLKLRSVQGNRLSLTADSHFCGEDLHLLEEVETSVSGVAVLPECRYPYTGNSEDADLVTIAEDLESSGTGSFELGDFFCKSLLEGRPLLCVLRANLRSWGEEKKVAAFDCPWVSS
eukprot:gnl/TRDRNA2_/TRDRNA2_165002_c1_seq4.p1 gnl/TRDRNA2_/TRDRNA2_165002_c1~~gnl/TRDRNA2_/TRDRNA2_165002_c1_seq4.p1  ORF type:complete len:309 (+),score=40.44 gnl/TRDRNA2_/TRDRNA2_165002_c1_seq4:125-928(+)